jgi:hypothetical protein
MATALALMPGFTAGPELLGKIRHGSPLTRQDIRIDGRPEATGATQFVKVLDDRGELAAVLECQAVSAALKYAAVFVGSGR